MKTIFFILFVMFTGSLFAQQVNRKEPSMKYHMYVAVSGDQKLLRYDMDPIPAISRLLKNFPPKAALVPLCTDPRQKYLYAALRRSKELVTYKIDPETGALEHVATAPFDGGSCYISTDKTGRYLFSAYYGEGAVAINAIDKNGAVLAPHRQWIPTDEHAHCFFSRSLQSIPVCAAYDAGQCYLSIYV